MKRFLFVALFLVGAFALFAQQDSTATEQDSVYVLDGKLGVGVSNPSKTLEVSGGIVSQSIGTGSSGYKIYSELNDSDLQFLWSSETEGAHSVGFFREDFTGSLFLRTSNILTLADTSAFSFLQPGKLGLGTSLLPTGARLAVNGSIYATEINVKTYNNGWPDHVFKQNFHLRPLSEVEGYINSNGHLPDLPSADEVQANGINIAEMQQRLLQKVEELTLYVIELQKENDQLQQKVNSLQKK